MFKHVIVGKDFHDYVLNDQKDDRLDIPVPYQQGFDAVILCRQEHQLVPYAIRLPHQVHLKDLKDAGHKGLYVIPYRSADAVHVAWAGDWPSPEDKAQRAYEEGTA